MANPVFIIRYGEIATKGANRRIFENLLMASIEAKLAASGIKDFELEWRKGRLLLRTEEEASSALSDIFGIVTFSRSLECDAKLDEIKKILDTLLECFSSKTSFRVTTKRSDKSFPKTSVELNVELGAYVQHKTDAKVDLKEPDKEILVELFEGKAYLSNIKQKGRGGLPSGSQGTVIFLGESQEDLISAILMMKRGCRIISGSDKNEEIDKLKRFQPAIEVFPIKGVPDASKLSETGISAIVKGGLLFDIPAHKEDMLTLYPLSGFTNKEVQGLIGEYLR